LANYQTYILREINDKYLMEKWKMETVNCLWYLLYFIYWYDNEL